MPYSDLFLTKKRLTEWGNWCYHIITMGLGYSNRSLIDRLQAEGGIIIQGTAKILVPTNEQAEEVNDLIERLAASQPEGKGKPEWAKVVRIHYTLCDENKEKKVQASKLNERTYYRYLKQAQSWISEQLIVC